MTNKTDKQYEDEHNDEVTLHSLIKALGLLVEAKELLDKAEWHNAKDEWMGDIPVMSIEIQEQAHNLKKLLGVPVDAYDTELFSIGQTPASPKNAKGEYVQENDEPAEKSDAPVQSNDSLGLHSAVDDLYMAIEKDDLETALKYVKWIEDTTRSYSDPRSEAHDHLNLFEQMQELYSAINAENKAQANEVIHTISNIADKGIKDARFDNEFEKEWGASHKQ